MVHMDLFDATLLGIVQGLTEFIPVSSSGHLILARALLGVSGEGSLAFDVTLHFATALAVLVYFRRDVFAMLARPREHRVLWGALVLGTIPAALIGSTMGDTITEATRHASVVAWMLVLGSVLFVLAERFGSRVEKLSVRKGFLIGVFQSFALVPGLSRSGASISAGILLGLDRERATRFAFLLGFPIILGTGLLKLAELLGAGEGAGGEWGALIVGSLVAFFVGLFAIHWMLSFLRTHSLYGFALYRVLLALLVALFL